MRNLQSRQTYLRLTLVGVLALFLWGWMALDAWMRFGRGYALLVLLSTPLGAGGYFFAVYLRRKFLPKRKV